MAATLQEMGKQDMESPTKADETIIMHTPASGPEDGHAVQSLYKQAGLNRAHGGIG